MAAIMDTANVSAAMRKRIAAALDAGEVPSLKKRRMHLGAIPLQLANGKDKPALEEVRLQMASRGLNVRGVFDAFVPNLYTRGNRTFAMDIAGVEHTIVRRLRGENRVTKTGRRFHEDSYTRWIGHVPTYLVRKAQARASEKTNST